MGNDQSHLSGLEIHEKAVEVTDFWTHHTAVVNASNNVSNISVFIGEPVIGGVLWATQTPLEKSSKNLMIYRHPCILKYISSWNKSSKYYLAVEDVKPLNHVLSTQNTLQTYIGLHAILKALCFLHEKALVSHNNICIASIYVTASGNWKLGGMEYLCKFSDLKTDYLNKTRSYRYDKAVDPNEDKNIQANNNVRDIVDIFAFGVLACEVLKKKTDDEIDSLTDFRELCKNNAQNVDISKRPSLRDLLQHSFFNHQFIIIHSFLMELPLKSDEEKSEFFLCLKHNLKDFDEIIVADQLGGLLLSRLVLLNKTAQNELLPYILCPRKDNQMEDNANKLLFSKEVFKKYLVPRLLEIFGVRDTQIRLLLLNHFIHFLDAFSKEELQWQILPELLVGIKDTNNELVAVTLRALANLVPVLGAAVVIGGKRAKLFNDGRPIVHQRRRSRQISKRHHDNALPNNLPQTSTEVINLNSGTQNFLELPERPRPDGEEGETSTDEIEQSVEDDLENWDDWDANENNESVIAISNSNSSFATESDTPLSTFRSDEVRPTFDGLGSFSQKKKLPDINELDIKNQKKDNSQKTDEFDFFQDMEPVIETSKYLLTKLASDKEDDLGMKFDKLNLNVEEHDEDGWGEEEDWN